MTGHWEYQGTGREFRTLDEMWEYINEHEYWFDDYDFEHWVNENYTAMEVLRDSEERSNLMLDLVEEFEEAVWLPSVQPDPMEGEDYWYNDEFDFTWVDDDEEGERWR